MQLHGPAYAHTQRLEMNDAKHNEQTDDVCGSHLITFSCVMNAEDFSNDSALKIFLRYSWADRMYAGYFRRALAARMFKKIFFST